MPEFTWIPLYMEIADNLLEWEDRQGELIDFLAELKERSIAVPSFVDQDARGKDIKLSEIDPFTFFATFNRGITNSNRIAILDAIRSLFGLKTKLPSDFHGVPLVHNMQSWFYQYSGSRQPEVVPDLWNVFRLALAADPIANPDFALAFDKAAKIKLVKNKLTIGLFWIRPNTFLALDSKNRSYLGLKNLSDPPVFSEYGQVLRKVSTSDSRPFPEISLAAWLEGSEKPKLPNVVDPDPIDNSTISRRFWKLAPGEKAFQWDRWRDEHFIGIGWNLLGDVKGLDKVGFNARVVEAAKLDSSYKAAGCGMVWRFYNEVQPGDLVLANDGQSKVLGYGVVRDECWYAEGEDLAHRRSIDWISTDARDIEKQPSWLSTLMKLDKAKFEKLTGQPLNGGQSLEKIAKVTGFSLDEIVRWHRALLRKKQAIFYGPPGTGKTFVAMQLANYLTHENGGLSDLVQFHPAYAYEDFMQGLRPTAVDGGGLRYELVAGRFLDFCQRASETNAPCVLIIDEINRANLARVFGELMYLLEYRDKPIPLAAGGEEFRIPGNVYIIGTMNTADRSIALVDFALRRRFAFLSLAPSIPALRNFHKGRDGESLVERLIKVMVEVNSAINDDNYALGMSFFMVDNLEETVEDIWRLEIEPYLEEYFFGQADKTAGYRWDNVQSRILEAE